MFGLSHLQFYDIQNIHNVSSTDRNIFKLGSNSILAKLIRSSELLYADDERNVNTVAMNLTANEKNNNGCNNNDSGKSSPTVRKHINRSINGGSNNSNNGNCNSDKDSVNTQDGHQKSSELNSPVNSVKINNDLAEVNANTTTINTDSLKRLTGITKQTFEMQKRKYLKVISFLNQHNRHLELELTKEKRRRAEELSKIIKSLLCFEAKLKHDKKVINQKLYERDTEISRLRVLNRVLRKKYAEAAALAENGDDIDNSIIYGDLEEGDFGTAQNCPSCRKDFYELSGKDVWTQTFVDGRSSIEDHTENGSSSDETVSSSFYGARRSVRYTSKRNFREYMRSRCMTIDDPSLDNSEENGADSNDNSTIYEKTNAFSRKIERLHGVRRIESFTDEAELDSENDSTRTINRRRGTGSESQLSPSVNGSGKDYESDEMFMPVKSRSYRAKKFAETSPKQEFEASTDDWYASASDLDDSENIRVKPYGYNAVNPVLECVNQILLQQSMDECIMDGPPSLESSENASGSSGGGSSQQEGRGGSRKRVHFSIKNSMVHVPRDDEMRPISSSPLKTVIDANEQKDCNLNYESIYSNEYERIGSEHNSSNLYVDMESKFGQEDRSMTITPLSDKPPKKPPALPPKPANLIKFKRVLKITPYCPVDSIKEDEPKTSEGGQEQAEEPDYCSISEVNEAITSVQIVADVHKSADDDLSSQTSEAALSQKTDDAEEIFADVPKLPNVAAIIVPKLSSKSSVPVDSFTVRESIGNREPTKGSQIPNILAEINKKMNTVPNIHLTPPTTPSKTVSLPGVIAISPSKIPPATKTPQTPTSPAVNAISVPLAPEPDKLPLQAEFDWYNLDAEYGKSNQPDVIKETDTNPNSNLEFHHHHHQMIMGTVNEVIEENDGDAVQDAINQLDSTAEQSVEYKLDEEFCLTNQPDIIKENVFENTTRTRTKSKTVCNGFPTITDESPCSNAGRNNGARAGGSEQQRAKINRKNYKNFMDASGLSVKPLPRQRKIYFSGPFV
ncbi:probable serine/threonine-protein kinase DDB_G0282963 isoform X1 [Hermetia illucens]|nr:probable serine/threonine-protein kinase DDB_G0282963 isoform X1 [Hermetia illucens]XP_037909812.1 probable serine/threonine-protein kinase DDB_G0282963 isoform X1 [Hermetia illucens]